MRVRPFNASDSPFLADIFYHAVHQIGRAFYSAEQVKAWAPIVPDEHQFIEWANDGRKLLVAANDLDHPIAYCDLETDGHIANFYCHPDRSHSDVSSLLFEYVQAAAVDQSITRIYVEASEPARRFFLKKEFVVLRRREFLLRDVRIHNFEMEKYLFGSATIDETGERGKAP